MAESPKTRFKNQTHLDDIKNSAKNLYLQIGKCGYDSVIRTKDGVSFKAHKSVLAACSLYLREAMSVCSDYQDPIVILHDVHSEDMICLIEFMYTGVTEVTCRSQLESVLEAAKSLKIEVLCDIKEDEEYVDFLSELENSEAQDLDETVDENLEEASRVTMSLPTTCSNSDLSYSDQSLGMDLTLSRGQPETFGRPLLINDYSNTKKRQRMAIMNNGAHNVHGSFCKKVARAASCKVGPKEMKDVRESQHRKEVSSNLQLKFVTASVTVSLIASKSFKTKKKPENKSTEEEEDEMFTDTPVSFIEKESSKPTRDPIYYTRKSQEDPKDSERSFKKKNSQGTVSEKKNLKYPSINPLTLFTLPATKNKGKQTRTSLALEEKVKVIESFLDGKSQRQIASFYGIGKTQVNGIIKKREEILSVYKESLVRGDKLTMKRNRRSEYSSINEHLIQWYRHMSLVAGVKITTAMLRAKALEIAPELGYHDFKASNGWLATFKANNNLKFSKSKKTSETYTNDSYEEDDNNADDEYFHEDEEIDSDEVAPNLNVSLSNAPNPAPPVHIRDNVHSEPVSSGINPSLLGPSSLSKPQMSNMSLGPNIAAAYNLARDHTRPDIPGSRPDLSHLNEVHSASAVNPLVAGTHSISKPDASLSYKSEESLAYGYDTQSRMNEGTSRGSDYNYTHYGFPSTYYGYHFLGQY